MMRADVVEQARRWLGTPYHHKADIIGVGVDCAMLPVRVFVDLGLVAPFDPRPYSHDWFLHRSEEKYLGWVEKFADKVDDPQPGDVALFRLGRCIAHGGILETPTVMIHADLHAGKVVRCEVSAHAEKLAGYWRVRL